MGDRDIQWRTLLFEPLQPFILHPERIACVAILFVLWYAALRSRGHCRAWPLLVAGGAWTSWVPWEMYAKAMRYDIRVDLLVIYPVLFAVTVWGLIASLWWKARSRPTR